MDIKTKIEEVVAKVKDDKNIATQFKNDPVKTIQSLIGVKLPTDQLNKIVDGVKAKVSIDKASDLLGKAKKLF